MSTVRFNFKVGGVLTDATSVVLSDEDGAFGVKRDDTDAVVVADGTAMTHLSTGKYEYTFDDPSGFVDDTYTFAVEAVYGDPSETYRWQDTLAGPASTTDYLVTLSDAKTYLGISASTDDAVITDMLQAATEAMEQFCGRHLVSTTVTEVLDGTGDRHLFLKEPAESITTIKIDSDQGFDDATAEDSDNYRVDGCTIDYYSRIWTEGRRNIQVVYLGGYATIPDDLQHACKAHVAKMYADWQTVKEGANTLESENVQGWSRKWRAPVGFDEEVKAILLRYIPARL